ncbi:MAG: ABC transporter ATP-binding protein [Clostridia bacterium]|nr:ABC transporter ATP-binding protein [Clostridia bacterium]MBR3639057.1 ABC transporter ATP-binding protein [Clostridia bacterium]
MKLEVTNIKKSFGRREVLSDITFSAQGGEVIGILGENGCGKSTLLSVMAGVLERGGGSMTLDGEDLFASAKKLRKATGYVPQGTTLLEELTARDNLRLSYDKETLDRELEDGVLKMLGVGTFLKKQVSKLSGGMKKRLSIACCVSARPPVLLLDEPCAALDLSCKASILDFIDAYRKQGGIAVLTSHDESEIAVCDRWYIMKNGVLTPYDYDGDVKRLVMNL